MHTKLQASAWRQPFLDSARMRRPVSHEPQPGWVVGLSVNL